MKRITLILLLALAWPCYGTEYGTQIYLDNVTASGNTWSFSWSPFANEQEAIQACAAKGIRYGRVMLVAVNITKAGSVANYKAYDGRLMLDHLNEWNAAGVRPILALRDYEWLSIADRAAMLESIYRACRAKGFNPVFTLGNEPDSPSAAVSGQRRYTPAELGTCAGIVIPRLKADYNDLEWWGPDTATAGWYSTYYAAIKQYNPTRRVAHTYDGNNTSGGELLATEINEALEKCPQILPDPWGMTEFVPYSKQYAAHSATWTAEMKRYFDGIKAQGADLIILWALNVPPRIFETKTTLYPAFAYAMSDNATPTPAPPTATPFPTATPPAGRTIADIVIHYSDGTAETRP